MNPQKLLIKKGGKKELVAVSHKIIKVAYHMLKNKEEYKEPTLQIEKISQRNKQKNIQKSISKLMELGFSVRLTPMA